MVALASLCLVFALVLPAFSATGDAGGRRAPLGLGSAPAGSGGPGVATGRAGAWPQPFTLQPGQQAMMGIAVAAPGPMQVGVNWEGGPLGLILRDPTGRALRQLADQKPSSVRVDHHAHVAGTWSLVILNATAAPAPRAGLPAQPAGPVVRGYVGANFPYADPGRSTAAPAVASAGPAPQAGIAPPPSGPTCMVSAVMPAAADVGDRVTLTGQGFVASCAVYFGTSTTSQRASIQILNPQELLAIVPAMPSGPGTVALINQAEPSPLQALRPGRSVPFEIKPTAPVLKTITPGGGLPGVIATVIGENLRQGDPYTAHFVTGDARRIDAPIQWLSLTAFRVIVPNVQTSPSVPDIPQNANRFYVHRGTLPSNALPFQALPAPTLGPGPGPVLDSTDKPALK